MKSCEHWERRETSRILEVLMRGGAVVVLVVTTLVGGCSGAREARQAKTTARVTARVAHVRGIAVPQTLELYGTVEADRVAAVSSRVMATVTAVAVKAGDQVKAGQVLVEIDSQTARGQEGQARGALAQAQAALALAERNYARFKSLAASGAASELELDMARMQDDQAKGAVEQAQGALEAAASVARESRVVAPFAGRVVAKLVEVGDLAAPGRPLVTVESGRGRRLVVAVPESAAAGLALGARLPVAIDALPDLGERTGEVVEMTPGADPASHSFTVKIRLADVDVPSGLAGRAWLALGSRPSLAVPEAAVLHQGGLSMVVVRDAEGRAHSRAVTLGGPLSEGRVEVLSGLAKDDAVLLGLAAVPPDGAPVEEAGS
jgi:membrane fusion protein, multidrug efflux system